jgi:hypothetical protein
MRSTRAIWAISLLPLLAAAALSQKPRQTNEDRERQRLVLQAIATIRQVATEAPGWNDKTAMVQVLTDAADLLWEDEPSQAAKWLRKAWNVTDQISSNPSDPNLKAFFIHSAQGQFRTMVLNVAHRHDRKLAEEFLAQISHNAPNDKKDRGAFDDRTGRSEQLLSMAQQVLDSNPQEAFTLAESSLSDGVSYSLQNVLTRLRAKNVQLANRLFDLALARFVGTPPDPSEAQILAGYLFQPGLTFSANSAGRPMLVLNPGQQNLSAVAGSEPERAKGFLIAVYRRLLTQPVAIETPEGKQRAQQILVLGNLISRRYAEFAPEVGPAVQGFLEQLQRQLMPEGRTRSESTSQTSDSGDTTEPLTRAEAYDRRISEMEERAEKESNAAFRKVDYLNAVVATKPEDYVRANRIAEKIEDDDLRADAISFVLYRAALFFADKTQVEKAIEIIPTIKDASRRAVVKIAIAQRLLLSKSEKAAPEDVTLTHQRVLDLLGDIDREFEKEEPSSRAAKILMGTTAVLAKVDKDQALTSLVQTVRMINRLDRFDLRNAAAPNLGISAVTNSTATIATPKIGFDFRSAIEPLIEMNFEQIDAIAERLTMKELRGVGRLEAAKLYLTKNRKSIVKESMAVVR